MSIKRLLGFNVLLVMVGCAWTQMTVDYDPQFDFTKLKTYDWIPNPVVTASAELVEKHLKTAMNAELEKKGYSQSADKPDFYIALHASKEDKVDVSSWGYGYGYGWYGYGGGVDVYQYEEGTAVFDFVDGEKKDLIWRGVVKVEIDRKASFEKRQKRIKEIVEKMLKDFPPGRKK